MIRELIETAEVEGRKFREANGRVPTAQEAEIIYKQVMTGFNLALMETNEVTEQ